MVIEQLEAQVHAELPPQARAGARVVAAAVHAGQEIEVVCRVDRNGRRVLDYFLAGARMERRTLLMLLCTEAACPQARQVQQRWRAFTGQPERSATARIVPLRVQPLMEEVPVVVGGHHCVARPASFECLTPCPMGTHPPQVLRKAGWDLFEDGVWIAGGLRTDETTGSAVPRFATPAEAGLWLGRQQDEARRLLEAVR